MIGQQSKSFLARTLQQQQRYGSLVQASTRGFAGGGPVKLPISADETEFDVICIGKSHQFCDYGSQPATSFDLKILIEVWRLISNTSL